MWPRLRQFSSQRRAYSTRSPHARWYSDTLPPMIPIALFGSAVYMGLHLTQATLAQDKEREESQQRLQLLEEELEEQLRSRDNKHGATDRYNRT